MIPLVKHIEYLVRRHDCVILPGLGALLAVHRAAVINESWAMALPPVRTLCFNSAIHHTDGLLATSVARKECISYAEATQVVESEMENYRSTLHADGQLRLGRLGLLKIDEEDCISFSPFRQDASTGFANVPLPRPSGCDATDIPTPAPDKRYLYLRIPRQALKTAACVALVVMAAFSFILPGTDTTTKRDHAAVLPIERLANPVEGAVPTALLPQDNPTVAETDTDRFFVVVGVFRNIKDCELFVAQHPSWAPRMEILSSGHNNFKVTVQAATTRDTLAYQLRTTTEGREIRAEFPQAWIWEQK